jgi:hypothetical protein
VTSLRVAALKLLFLVAEDVDGFFYFFRFGDSKVGGDEGSEVQTHDCPFVGRYQALVPSVVLHVQYQDLVYVTEPILKFEVHLCQVKFVDEREG